MPYLLGSNGQRYFVTSDHQAKLVRHSLMWIAADVVTVLTDPAAPPGEYLPSLDHAQYRPLAASR
jgi:hypothetical protein